MTTDVQAAAYRPGDTIEDVAAVVRWFNDANGYGFAALGIQEMPDAFIPFSVLDKATREVMEPGRRLRVAARLSGAGWRVTRISSVLRTVKGEVKEWGSG